MTDRAALPAVAWAADVTASVAAVMPPASSTAATEAVTAVAARRGIAAGAVVAFGDMPNDLSMLAWAGTSYAVANAHPEVLAAVDHVIPANNEDGVAQVIEALFPGPA